jgi:hypothetical protein
LTACRGEVYDSKVRSEGDSDVSEEKIATLLLGAIMEMSDRAQALGGAGSIAGIAALHTLQTSLQKNRPRVLMALQKYAAEEAH